MTNKGDLISREALKKAACVKFYTTSYYKHILDFIDNAPTVEFYCPYLSDEEIKQPCLQGPCERPQGEWIDYDNTFYKCPDCGYLLEKCCPQCQNKVVLPKGGADMRGEKE